MLAPCLCGPSHKVVLEVHVRSGTKLPQGIDRFHIASLFVVCCAEDAHCRKERYANILDSIKTPEQKHRSFGNGSSSERSPISSSPTSCH